MQDINCIKESLENKQENLKRHKSALVDLSSWFTELIRPTSKEVSLFREQFYTLILNANSLDRKTIAKNLSRSEYAPKAIIIFLVMEEIAIANLPLLCSPVLQTSDLNLILSKCSIEHAKVIARRDNLETSTLKALLKVDNEARQIYHILSATIDASKLDALIYVADENDNCRSHAAEITTNATLDIKKPKVSEGSKDLTNSLLKLANKGGKISRKPLGKPKKSTFNQLTLKQIENQLLAAARFNDLTSFVQSIKNFCGLEKEITMGLLTKQDAGRLASLLCALGVSEISAARILLLLNRNIGRNAQIFKIVMVKYKALEQDKCTLYFTQLGADFTKARFHDGEDKTTTRYALSLAARDRRAVLLKENQFNEDNYKEQKLSA